MPTPRTEQWKTPNLAAAAKAYVAAALDLHDFFLTITAELGEAPAATVAEIQQANRQLRDQPTPTVVSYVVGHVDKWIAAAAAQLATYRLHRPHQTEELTAKLLEFNWYCAQIQQDCRRLESYYPLATLERATKTYPGSKKEPN